VQQRHIGYLASVSHFTIRQSAMSYGDEPMNLLSNLRELQELNLDQSLSAVKARLPSGAATAAFGTSRLAHPNEQQLPGKPEQAINPLQSVCITDPPDDKTARVEPQSDPTECSRTMRHAW
jgi:hypothetical protein